MTPQVGKGLTSRAVSGMLWMAWLQAYVRRRLGGAEASPMPTEQT